MSETKSTKFEMPRTADGPSGHATIDMYVHRERDFDVSFRDIRGDDMVCLHIGLLSLIVTPEQWRALSDAVESVLPKTVSA